MLEVNTICWSCLRPTECCVYKAPDL